MRYSFVVTSAPPLRRGRPISGAVFLTMFRAVFRNFFVSCSALTCKTPIHFGLTTSQNATAPKPAKAGDESGDRLTTSQNATAPKLPFKSGCAEYRLTTSQNATAPKLLNLIISLIARLTTSQNATAPKQEPTPEIAPECLTTSQNATAPKPPPLGGSWFRV